MSELKETIRPELGDLYKSLRHIQTLINFLKSLPDYSFIESKKTAEYLIIRHGEIKATLREIYDSSLSSPEFSLYLDCLRTSEAISKDFK